MLLNTYFNNPCQFVRNCKDELFCTFMFTLLYEMFGDFKRPFLDLCHSWDLFDCTLDANQVIILSSHVKEIILVFT